MLHSFGYADAFLRSPSHLPPPTVPFYYRGPTATIIPLTDPGLWLPRSCAIAVLDHVIAGSVGSGSVTTGGINASGATILVGAVIGLNSPPSLGVTTSNSNAISYLTLQSHASGLALRLFFTASGSYTNGMTVSVANSAWSFLSVAVLALSGVASTPLDQQNGTTTGTDGTSLQPGSITPGEDNEIIVAAVTTSSTETAFSINGGFTIADQFDLSGGNHFSLGLAYLIQTTAAAANPTWSWTGTQSACTSQGSFKATAVSGNPWYAYAQQRTRLTIEEMLRYLPSWHPVYQH